ncbi:MAG: hypothetical protein WCK01_00495 [Candidatus Uhrbacteria bacterium]
MHVLLTLDLNYLKDSTKRTKFYEELANRQWKKFRNETTTWRASFKPGATADGCIRATKTDVADAAAAAGITRWDAVCHVGDNEPTEF